MATDLDRPQPDEPLFGAVSRYAEELRVQDWRRFLLNLFGFRAHFSPAFAYNLSRVADSTWATWGMSAEGIVEQCTLFPLYAAFVSRTQANAMMASLVVRRARSLPGFMFKLVQQPKIVRLCDACLEDDAQNRRPWHFRRAHQIPGVVVCPRHGIWLRYLSYPSSAVIPWPGIHEVRTKGSIVSLNADPGQVDRIKRVARAAQYFLDCPVRVDGADLRQLCWKALHDAGFARGRDALSISRVVREFISFYGEDYLRMVRLSPMTDQNWIAARLAGRQNVNCALPSLLLGIFCGAAATTYPSERWPFCPNLLASHGPMHRVEAREQNNGRYYAYCRCGHSISYRTVIDGYPTDAVVSVYGPDFAAAARSLCSRGWSVAAIARELRISETTARRMICTSAHDRLPSRHESAAQLRERWRHAVRLHGTVRMTALAEPGLWKAMRRYAPEELMHPAKIPWRMRKTMGEAPSSI